MHQTGLPRKTAWIPLLFWSVTTALVAQESSITELPGLKERAIIIEIIARIAENEHTDTWISENTKITIPGKPVIIKLVGSNLVIFAQFTPYTREDGKNFLVAQGQVWIETAEGGLKYQTTMQTIPLDYGEKLFFYPLGQKSKDKQAQIEIQLALRPYNSREGKPEENVPAGGDTSKK